MDRRQIGCLIAVVILLSWVSVTLADTVPEEAQRYMARGMAAVGMAETLNDYKRAVSEFEQAAKLAPNWPDVYFNLGSIQAKAGNYGEAMRHYKRYLELVPKAPDAAKVREEIYKLEYRAEEKVRVRNRFIAYNNGTVLDTRTNLMWAAKDNGENINWANAKSYCEKYRGGGYSDWRMPTLDELGGLYDAGKSYKSDCGYSDLSYDVHLTELIRLTCTWAWTSETRGSDAETVGFLYGRHTLKNQRDTLAMRALPVRLAELEVNNPLPGSAPVPSLLIPSAYKGVRNYENGDKYEGQFTNRKFNGKGTYTYANGDKYEGEFVDGKFTSKGTFTCGNGRQFTGNLEGKEPLRLTITCD
jgi:tetratricopeptide (TPR) repeat protein